MIRAEKTGSGIAALRVFLFLTVFSAVFFSLVFTARDVGMGWDEGNDVRRAADVVEWFGNFGREGTKAFSGSEIEKYWSYGWQGHPSVTRIIHAVSGLIFHRTDDDPVFRAWIVYRYGTFVVFSALVAGVFLAGWGRFGHWTSGAVSAAAVIFMPRMFGHAHFVETDMVLCAFWFAAAFAFLRGLETAWGSVLFGLLMGLLPAIKFTGCFVIIPLMAYGAAFERKKVLRNLAAAAVISPLIFFLVQPMLWHHPIQAFLDQIRHLANLNEHVNLTIHYFGKDYWKSPTMSYPFVMTVVSIPAVTLFLALAGTASAFRRGADRKFLVFLLINAFFLLVLFMPRRVVSYDGERLFMAVFPFWAMLAGAGFGFLSGRINVAVRILALLVFFVWGALTLQGARPFYLCYYNELVGGVAGAERRGLEVMYWGEAFTPEFAERINVRLPAGARITTIGYFSNNLRFFQEMGLLRDDFRIVDYGREADFLILFNRMGVLDPLARHLLEKAPPLIGVRWKGITVAAVYVLKPGLDLFRGPPGPPEPKPQKELN